MNEILQWLAITILIFVVVIPSAVRVYRDFKEEDEEKV